MLTTSTLVRPEAAPDLAALKTRQQATWASGDYAVVGTTLQLVGERLCETLDVQAGERVLDVAAGNGNVALAAARCGGEVTATDYVPALLDRARARAVADGLPMTFEEADAEALPFADASFDLVVSTFGVMFTADHRRAADELLRVCRPGGRIGMSNWTPNGFIGRLFRTIGRHLPPPAGATSPARWGDRDGLDELFAGRVASIDSVERRFVFRYRSPRHFLDVFKQTYGPTLKAFAALDTAAGAALEQDILALIARFDRGGGPMAVASAYLETVIVR